MLKLTDLRSLSQVTGTELESVSGGNEIQFPIGLGGAPSQVGVPTPNGYALRPEPAYIVPTAAPNVPFQFFTQTIGVRASDGRGGVWSVNPGGFSYNGQNGIFNAGPGGISGGIRINF